MDLYMAARGVIAPTARTLWPLRVEGLHHVPRTGPVILASNHLALIDPLFIGVVVPRQIIFVAKKELFSERTLPQRAFTRALRAIGQVPVDRSAGYRQDAMQASLDFLNSGAAFGIFPEGTRSPDGRLYRGRTGLAWLALTSQAPVIPIALSGTPHILPPGRRIPRFNRIGMRFGPPVDLSAWEGQGERARARRAATNEIMSSIQRLSGQTMVDRYASDVKKA
ncbi:1-acyl-sn-glycerol-3-phosphate acyltransferase [Spiractinospora alimapuensis]|uniref:lysophospholipid acyltransferase family protein n=1 Tax=Spiractinospora alimapuensis TaxID=2820884 RepID=UPI001F3E7EE1|nr:lysophospholipid acyltransferase family protein [Spiractinospora alimapuensis]QVQ54653.1 1-acyl-sn-glycerol-3-phosphate acyltransferase [Spiractinospora alimapuensis]